MPETLDRALEEAIERLDIDGVMYKLNQIAVSKRDDKENMNKAEVKYWKEVQLILSDAQEKLEALND